MAATFAAAGLDCGVTIEIGGGTVPDSASFPDFLAGQPPEEPEVEIHGDDIWELLFTSGTTASPKAAMRSHSSAYLAAYGFALTLSRGQRFDNDVTLCSFLPLVYHIGDTIFGLATFAAGGTLVVGRRPEPRQSAAAVTAERATALWGGSSQLVRAFAEVVSAVLAPTIPPASPPSSTAGPPCTRQRSSPSCGKDLVMVEIFGQTEAIACHRFWPAKWEVL